MTEPTLADVVARLEAIEKRLEKLDAIEEQFQFVEVAPIEEPEETFEQTLRQIKESNKRATRRQTIAAAQAVQGLQQSSPEKNILSKVSVVNLLPANSQLNWT